MPRHHAHHDPAPPACCSCCCGCAGAATCYYPAPAPPPPSSAASDQLLHAIAAHLLLSSPAPAQPQPQPQPPPAAHHATNPYPYPYPHPHQYQYQHQYQQQEAKPHAYTHPQPPPQQQQQQQPSPSGDHGRLLLHSLLRRVAALESTLPRCLSAPPPARRPPHPDTRPRRTARYQDEQEQEQEQEESESEPEPESPPSPPPRRAGPPSAASERAARTIQAHFRRFLARRSRTLHQLKELAVLRSKAAAIRGSLSGRRGRADPAAVSEAAMDLLLRLDAIQGGDPMLREGKRAVSRELTRILEFVDKVLVKEHEHMAMGDDALDTDGYRESCNAAFVAGRPSMSKKKVSFSGNGQARELNGKTENGNEVDEDSEGSSSGESDDVEPSKRSANGKPGLAAPMPVHMESRPVPGGRR